MNIIKRNKKITIIVIIISISIFIGTIYYFLGKTDPSSNLVGIPRIMQINGELIEISVSPKGTYTIQTYHYKAFFTSKNIVYAELIINSKKSESIYFFKNNFSLAEIDWLDDDTVFIDEHKIKLPNGFYSSDTDESKENGSYAACTDKDGNYITNTVLKRRLVEKDSLLKKKK